MRQVMRLHQRLGKRRRRANEYFGTGEEISLSVPGEAIFRTCLPAAPTSYLIETLGYSLGFLAVIPGRMQLFTETAITMVLPVMAERPWQSLSSMLRLRGILLSANLVGAFAVAALIVFTPALPGDIMPAIVELSHHATGMGASASFWRGIPAGVIVALIVWMMPQVESSKFLLLLAFTWLIAAGDFTHIVAGSVEMAILFWMGELGAAQPLGGFFLPVLASTIIGGPAICTLMAWGQVRDDLPRS